MAGKEFGIVHVALWTRDVAEAKSFWMEYFGAEAGPGYHSKRRAGFESCFLRLPAGPQIELMTGPWISGRQSSNLEEIGWAHVAISVGSIADVDQFAEKLRYGGYLVAEPRTTGDGYYEAIARTPDGILIEIVAD